jgi:TolA-binding protein
MKKIVTIILALLVVVGGGGYLLAQGADAAEPGDTLYSVDLLAEDVQRLLTFDELKKAVLENDILAERVSELESLSDQDLDVEDILAEVTVQQDRVQEHLGTLEGNTEMAQNQEFLQLKNQYQEQLQQHITVMEKVQNKGDDGALQVKQQLEENLDNCSKGTCGSTEAGSASEDSNGNGNSPTDSGQQGGNEDSGSGNTGSNGSDNSGGSGNGGNPNN